MARVLVIGLGPLLAPGVRHIGGQCLRTWHFTRPLREAGHDVALVTVPAGPAPRFWPEGGAPAEPALYDGFEYEHLVFKDIVEQVRWLQRRVGHDTFDAIVAVNTYPAQLVAMMATRLPVWADLNGWAMAEAQVLAIARGGAAGSEAGDGGEANLRWSWRQERSAVWRADRLSTVSLAQRHATIAELAAMGRLGAGLADPSFVTVVPNACAPVHLALGERRKALVEAEGAGAPLPLPDGAGDDPPDAFRALWSGGFNTWTDIDALVRGLDEALTDAPRLRLVVTGGAIEGYHAAAYERFAAWAAGSRHAARVRLLGWLPTEEMERWYAASHVGLNFDAVTLEATFGARNRLTNMAASGLAVVSSRGTEVVTDLERAEAGWFFAPGDAAGLAAALCDAAADPAVLVRGVRAFDFAREAYRDARTVAPLLEWLKAPVPAPDHAERQRRNADPLAWQFEPLNSLQQHEMLWPHEDAEALRLAAASLASLRAKWPVRAWRAVKSALGAAPPRPPAPTDDEKPPPTG